MTDWLWFVLSTLALLGAYAELSCAWARYQRRRAQHIEVRRRLLRVVVTTRKEEVA